MLVVTRKTGERVHVGDDITVTVVSVGYDCTRIGMNTSNDVPIIREEWIGPPWSTLRRPNKRPAPAIRSLSEILQDKKDTEVMA